MDISLHVVLDSFYAIHVGARQLSFRMNDKLKMLGTVILFTLNFPNLLNIKTFVNEFHNPEQELWSNCQACHTAVNHRNKIVMKNCDYVIFKDWIIVTIVHQNCQMQGKQFMQFFVILVMPKCKGGWMRGHLIDLCWIFSQSSPSTIFWWEGSITLTIPDLLTQSNRKTFEHRRAALRFCYMPQKNVYNVMFNFDFKCMSVPNSHEFKPNTWNNDDAMHF